MPRQSLLLLLAAGLIIPAIVAFAIGFSTNQAERRRDLERNGLTVVHQIMDLTDAEIEANMRSLRVIGASRILAARDWPALDRLVARVMEATPDWKALVVRDTDTGAALHQIARSPSSGALRPLPKSLKGENFAEGAFRDGRYCPCVVIDYPVADDPGITLTLYLSPDKFQSLMLKQIEPGTVAAIVDRKGRYLARSLDFADRVGTPATIYVRHAVERGGQGIYEGKTYEGLKNYTAYATSPTTGWSAHVAIDRDWIDGPRARSLAALAVAVLAGLVLAIGLIVYVFHDTRVRRRDALQMLELQKAEAIGRFTSIIVHDFRNILAVLRAGTSQIRRTGEDERTTWIADAMDDALGRGDRLVNQLLSFARGESSEADLVDLEALLQDCDELIRRSLGEGVRYSWSIDPDARFVMANRDQLELALINLARNASDAMEGKGEFTIDSWVHDDMVELRICDSGPGVPKEIRARVFDALFTTKSANKGTGLGLAQVAGAVRQVGGELEVDNRPEGGARFRLYLPAES